jgi:hypothetical protein
MSVKVFEYLCTETAWLSTPPLHACAGQEVHHVGYFGSKEGAAKTHV